MSALDELIRRTRVEPRPYQARIVGRTVGAFTDKGLRSVLIESPTGSGKTVMGLLIAKALQERFGLRVGWVAMRRYLLAQAAAENRARGIGVDATFLSMFDKDPPSGLDLLVVDEAQHDAAASMAHLHNVVKPRFILGLSATPFRADRVKLCFDTVVKDAGIATLIRDGYLSRYRHYTLPDFRPATVAEFIARDPARWGQSVCYFHTLPRCEEAARLLRAAGVRCEIVTGSSDRDEQLDRFRAGEVDVLLNCMVLAEGFDYPALKTVFCRPSGRALTIQMAGRVLRQHPELPVKQVVQCPKTRWPFGRTAAPDVQYVWSGGEWRTLTVNPDLERINVRTLQALARTEVKLPAFLERVVTGTVTRRRGRRWRGD
jgi:superfamily II DNA or RNA helicase